jgi:hypothetical protein
MDGMAMHWHSLEDFGSPIRRSGETDNPQTLLDLRYDGLVAVLVQKGMGIAVQIWREGEYISTVVELNNSGFSTTIGC